MYTVGLNTMDILCNEKSVLIIGVSAFQGKVSLVEQDALIIGTFKVFALSRCPQGYHCIRTYMPVLNYVRRKEMTSRDILCPFNSTTVKTVTYLCFLECSNNLLGVQHALVRPPLFWPLKEDDSGVDGDVVFGAQLRVAIAIGGTHTHIHVSICGRVV